MDVAVGTVADWIATLRAPVLPSLGLYEKAKVLRLKALSYLFPLVERGVPKVGLEPTHPCGYQILSLARLPFRHFGKDLRAKHPQD